MKKLSLFIILTLLGIVSLYAQTFQIKGRVIEDVTNTGIPNASVAVEGSTKGTISDENGNFSISVEGKKVNLLITSIGFSPKNITTNGSASITVVLTREQAVIGDEVVVIGYASIKRKDLTGSVSSVNSKQIKDVQVSSAAEALQGRLAGVQITSTQGDAGADVIVRVRGGGSITQDNSPLYIVDGVQVDNALSVIAPQDIASIDVLKDASTTAIYGARAANGVVMITTKAGKPGKTQVNYSGAVGWKELPNRMSVLSPYDFVLWQYERSRGNTNDSTNFSNNYGTTWDTLGVYKDVPAIDWQDEVFGKQSLFQNHNVSVNGGTAATTFNLSLTANIEDGIILNSDYQRYIANFKLDHKISNKVKIGVTTRYLEQTINGAGTVSTSTLQNTVNGNRLRSTILYSPFLTKNAENELDFIDFDLLNSSGNFAILNPIAQTEAEYQKRYSKSFFLSGYLNYNILKNLVFRSTVGYDNSQSTQDRFYSKVTGYARSNGSSLPMVRISNNYSTSVNFSNTLQYTLNNYKNDHDFMVLLGQEVVERNEGNGGSNLRYFPEDISAEDALNNLSLGIPFDGTPRSFVDAPSRIFSLFGRATYGYKDRYLVTFNLRSDNSSKFSSENGSLVFPSGSAAWRFSKEKFMDNANWLNDGKLRIGYGIVGNNRIRNLAYAQLYNTTGQYSINRQVLFGYSPSGLANPSLQWEKNKSFNLGLDLSFLKDRLQLTIDLYKNSASDLLLDAQIPPTTGYTGQIQNIGGTSNRGIEIQINAIPIEKKNFTWNTNFNIAANRNKVENLGGVNEFLRNSRWQGQTPTDYLVRVGEPIGLMYGFITDGFYKVDEFDYNPANTTYTLKAGIARNPFITPQPGTMKLKDISGPDGKPDGIVDVNNDRTVIGNANPDFIGGWNNQFTYKNFDASIFVNFVVGNDILNANKIEWTTGRTPNLNLLSVMKNRFTYINAEGVRVTDPVELAELNANAQIWTPDRNQEVFINSWAIEDGSYLRINNITLGYSLPKKVISKAKISGFRVFTTINNLYNFTNYSGFDPDVTSRQFDVLTPGVEYAALPRARAFIMGVNVTF